MVKYLFALLVIFIFGKTLVNPILAGWKVRKRRLVGLFGKNFAIYKVELLRLLVFIKLFANSLTIVFLPQYMLKITLNAGFSAGWASFLYVCYQATFILMILPAGYLVEAKYLKRLLTLVIGLEAAAFLGFSLANNFWEILALQIIFGILVPISSATEYAYIFKLSSVNNRNEMLAMYNNTLKGAIIVGTFCGGFIVNWIGAKSTFVVACLLDILALLCTLIFLPAIKPKYDNVIKRANLSSFNLKYVFRSMLEALRNLSLMKTLLLVVMPLGFLEDGIVLFGLPLYLSNNNINYKSIGQILVLFSVAFFLTNKFLSQKADKLRIDTLLLFLGLIGFSCALLVISGVTVSNWYFWLVGGIFLLGLFRGFVVTPAIGYTVKHPMANLVGKNVLLAIYRVFESFGRIIGPIIIMQLFIAFNYSSLTFLIAACMYLLLGTVFIILSRTRIGGQIGVR